MIIIYYLSDSHQVSVCLILIAEKSITEPELQPVKVTVHHGDAERPEEQPGVGLG